jgi:hypothetical protein
MPGNLKEKKIFGKPKHRWENIIKIPERNWTGFLTIQFRGRLL